PPRLPLPRPPRLPLPRPLRLPLLLPLPRPLRLPLLLPLPLLLQRMHTDAPCSPAAPGPSPESAALAHRPLPSAEPIDATPRAPPQLNRSTIRDRWCPRSSRDVRSAALSGDDGPGARGDHKEDPMFDTLEMSLTVLEQLAPMETKIRQRRKSLADEIGRAAES